ncbi:MAG: hypothetical protein KME25_10025 [Symplocastrum torsivum CPER-KK1]|jgi:hypothetical protein|uniref:Uncharacterized protein n=1 Tax=Symplocastrum torsivum CPER-KK1 TaxID=450513 RepID=A0A951PJR0_9CYAN|nr:hypothetical protein [Symplocastrum torsivum CPER-KK1]
MVTKKRLLFLCSAAIAITLIWLQKPTSAQSNATQEGWGQPYTPTRFEWLVVKLPSYNRGCVGYVVNGQNRESVYRWSQTNDDQLRLTVASRDEDLKFCASLAFEELQAECATLQLNPPTVQLRHFDQDTGANRVWRCSVPAKGNQDNFVDFERVCQLQ